MVVSEMSVSDLRVPNVPLAQCDDYDEDLLSLKQNFTSRTISISDVSNNSSQLTTPDISVDINNANNRRPSRSPRAVSSDRSLDQQKTGGLLKMTSSRGVSPNVGDKNSLVDNNSTTFSEELVCGGGSLEDLVEHFDEKISKCFSNLDESTQQMAPVQLRTHDEIMADSQVWWTLTGNFGNILPIDWSKTQTRKLQLPALNLQPKKEKNRNNGESSDAGLSESDEELHQQLDMHQLVTHSGPYPPTPSGDSPPQTADQVIEEIDQIMQQSSELSQSVMTDQTMESVDSMYSSMRSPLPTSAAGTCLIMARDPDLEAKVKQAALFASSPEKLESLPYNKLVSLNGEMEQLIQVYNESLVEELALKDELDYEKELKNTFISLLLTIQNKRRQYVNERKRKPSNANTKVDNINTLPQFMVVTIPYQEDAGTPNNGNLQALIKILRAINDDNPNVPNMLTDYILKVICPSAKPPKLSDMRL